MRFWLLLIVALATVTFWQGAGLESIVDRDGEDEDSEASPHGRDEYRRAQRLGADGTIRTGALLEAKQVLDGRRAALSKGQAVQDGGIGNWSWLGPRNVGGRIRAIVRHPTDYNILWIGAAGGGIWKTTDGGSLWASANDFLPALSVSSMAIDPNNPDVLYASTGEGFSVAGAQPGAGVFKSRNGGATWTQIPSTTQWAYTTRLAHHSGLSNVVYLATPWSGVHRTNDGGATWNQVYFVPAWRTTDVKVSPWNGNLVAIAGEPFVALSTDGGATFDLITPSPPLSVERFEVAFGRDGSTDYLYALTDSHEDPNPDDDKDEYLALLWRTADYGDTWSLMNSSELIFRTQADHDNLIWVDPTNHDRLIVGGIDLWRSVDGGATLTRISDWHTFHTSNPGFSPHADQHTIVTNATFDGTNNKTLYVGNDGGIQKALDFTTVSEHSGWVNLSPGLGITQFYHGAASSGGAAILGGAQDNSFLRYSSADGTDWHQAVTGDGGFAAIDPSDSQIMYAEIQYLWLQKTTNGGQTWSESFTGLLDAKDKDNATFIAPFALMPFSPSTLFAAGRSIWKSTNAAANWSLSLDGDGREKATAIATSGSSVVWVGRTDGSLDKTTNGGADWTSTLGPRSRFVTDIAIDAFNANHVVVTYGGYELDTIWETTNGGTNWAQIRGTTPYNIPAIQINAVSFHPLNSDWIFVGTDLGVLATEDGGATWNQTPRYSSTGNDGPVNTEVSDLFWHGEFLVAATHGRGMYQARPMITAFVNAAAGSPGDGSIGNPYQSLINAEAGTGNGTTFVITSGTYGPVTITKRHDVVITGPVVVQ